MAFLEIVSCKNNEISPEIVATDKYLISANKLTTYTAKDAKTTIKQAKSFLNIDINIDTLDLKYDSDVYKITYKTLDENKMPTVASGCLIVPRSTDSLIMVSYQHRTIKENEAPPSSFTPFGDVNFAATFSTAGYIFSCPDYLGYGASEKLDHPYEHRESLAQAILDMTRASAEFLRKNNIKWKNKLMLTGYSEGGFATMSALKKIEENTNENEFNVLGASCGSGAYNKTAFLDKLVLEKTYSNPTYNFNYMWLMSTYNRIYKLNRKGADFFKTPYAAKFDSTGYNADFKVILNDAFSDAFKNAIRNKTDAPFFTALADNDVFNWKPKTEIKLFHGDTDQLVLYLNSQTAYENIKAKGGNITLTTLTGKDHSSGLQGFLKGTYAFFKSKK
ncbi:MAG: phospholipase [Pseudarcicella sp.]|nr:phospholipase [Pseudarcicella sp.]